MQLEHGFSIANENGTLRLVLSEDYDPDRHGLGWVEAMSGSMDHDCLQVHLDLNGYNRLDSRFFAGLLQVRRHLDEHGVRDVLLRGMGPQIHVGMDLLRLRPYFRCDHAGHRGVQLTAERSG
ncbi:MAG: hypothetical protein ACOCXJ_00940 [Planctomycetota bacterium]